MTPNGQIAIPFDIAAIREPFLARLLFAPQELYMLERLSGSNILAKREARHV